MDFKVFHFSFFGSCAQKELLMSEKYPSEDSSGDIQSASSNHKKLDKAAEIEHKMQHKPGQKLEVPQPAYQGKANAVTKGKSSDSPNKVIGHKDERLKNKKQKESGPEKVLNNKASEKENTGAGAGLERTYSKGGSFKKSKNQPASESQRLKKSIAQELKPSLKVSNSIKEKKSPRTKNHLGLQNKLSTTEKDLKHLSDKTDPTKPVVEINQSEELSVITDTQGGHFQGVKFNSDTSIPKDELLPLATAEAENSEDTKVRTESKFIGRRLADQFSLANPVAENLEWKEEALEPSIFNERDMALKNLKLGNSPKEFQRLREYLRDRKKSLYGNQIDNNSSSFPEAESWNQNRGSSWV